MSEINERLKKIYALAQEGSEGEKEVAQQILDELLVKYGKSLSEIEDSAEEEKVEYYRFTFHGATEKRLLNQIMYKVTNNSTYYIIHNPYSGRLIKTEIGCYCTKSQKIEIEFLFSFYTRLFWKEHDLFISAFIQKHRLFGDPTSDVRTRERSYDEDMRIFQMMQGLSDESPLLAIEDGGDRK